jgi:hypothetical protein
MFKTDTGTALIKVSSGANSLVVFKIDIVKFNSKFLLYSGSLGSKITLTIFDDRSGAVLFFG